MPALLGAMLALAAALLFGASTPVVQRLGAGVGPFTTAALLYAGAALVGALLRKPATREARLVPSDAPRLLGVALLGAVVGPAALAWGLQRTSGAGASLILTLEALFTAVIAWALYGEAMDRRVRVAMLLLLAGGAALVLDQGRLGSGRLAGLLAVLAAAAAWGADNALSRGLAQRDPGQVVLFKASLGAAATALIAIVLREPVPAPAAGAGLLAVGATGYGLSLRLYLLAQREFGAARTGSVFAVAPFAGALVALGLGERSFTWMMGAGGLLILCGVALHLAERHKHEHAHEALAHEHAHTHDDGHHDHGHAVPPEGPHSHRHVHDPVRHTHAHVPDAHHTHRHG